MRHLLFVALLLLTYRVIAQAAYTLDSSNIVYAGIANLVIINIPNVPASQMTLIPSFGTIRPDTIRNRYLWEICHLDSNRATLLIRKKASDQILDAVTFKAKMLPPPSIDLRIQNCGGCPENQCGIAAFLKNFKFDVHCSMEQFEVGYISKGQDLIEKINHGARFNSEVQDLIRKAKPGDKYIFRKFHFKCGCDETVRRNYEPIIYTVK
jgi:hypothetical protein